MRDQGRSSFIPGEHEVFNESMIIGLSAEVLSCISLGEIEDLQNNPKP